MSQDQHNFSTASTYLSNLETGERAAPRRRDHATGDLLSRVSQLEQQQALTNEQVCKLVAENDRLRQENLQLRDDAGPSKIRDPLFSRKVREYLQELATREGRPNAWNFSVRFDDMENKRILEALKGYIRSLPNDMRKPTWSDRFVEVKAFNNFRALQATQNRKSSGTLAAYNKKKVAGKRRAAKLKQRVAALQHDPRLLEGYEGGEALLHKELMSDDEVVHDEHGLPIAEKTLRPSWRSRQANEFLDLLTTASLRAKASTVSRMRTLPADRRYSTVAVRQSEGHLAKLPSWAKAASPREGQ